MLNKKKNNKGFTLVELLVVIAIIGILAVVAVPALFSNIEKSKVAKLEGNISALRSAALSFYTDNNEYAKTEFPATVDDLKLYPLGKYTEGLRTAFGDETYHITGEVGGESILTITLTKAKLSDRAIEKLENDIGATVENPKEIKCKLIEAN